ncbi:MAG: 23S rRNA (adenine(2030)-N(6))-methyltransferase RlmJ, partial [Gammaproteobacteria bacterium]
TGIYALWYPMLHRKCSRKLPEQLKALPVNTWLHATLTIKTLPEDSLGMFGSGMFVINPPWTLHDTLQETLPWLAEVLSEDDTASFTLERNSE